MIPANLWRTIGGNTYYYQNYAMQKNAWINDGDGWYYMDGDGLAKKGMVFDSGKRYYLDDATGKMQYGWKDQDGKWYYLGSSGSAQGGWVNDNGAWYFADHDTGVMRTGWFEENGRHYFLEGSGRMATGWTNQDGKWYYLDGSGAMATGWINDNGARYYADGNGVMRTGWLDDGGYRYYLRGNGAMATGWREMDGAWYYFDGGRPYGDELADHRQYLVLLRRKRPHGHGADRTWRREVLSDGEGRMAANTTVTVDGVAYVADGSGARSASRSRSATDPAQVRAGRRFPPGQSADPGQGQGSRAGRIALGARAEARPRNGRCGRKERSARTELEYAHQGKRRAGSDGHAGFIDGGCEEFRWMNCSGPYPRLTERVRPLHGLRNRGGETAGAPAAFSCG